MDYKLITVSPFLQIAADYDHRAIIACAALHEAARYDNEFKRLQANITYVKCEDGVQREPIDRLGVNEGSDTAICMAIACGLVVGVKYSSGLLRYVHVETTLGKPLAVLDVFAWAEASSRRNCIDLVHGGFIRTMRLMREYHSLVEAPGGKLDLAVVYPEIDLDLYVKSDGERLKRSGFIRSLLQYLEARNPRPEKGRINDLIKLCRVLLNITVSFESVDGDKSIAIDVRLGDEVVKFNFPRGILACNVRDHHVLAELGHAREALANKPLF